MVYHIAWVGMLMAALTLGTQAAEIYLGSGDWQTIVFHRVVFRANVAGACCTQRNSFIVYTGVVKQQITHALGAAFLFIAPLLLIYVPHSTISSIQNH